MVIQAFPDVATADEHGLLAIGGDIEVESLLLAYKQGIFPWPIHKEYLTWFAPPERALLFTDEVHFSKSFKKTIKKNEFVLGINTHFEEVVRCCAESTNRGEQQGTWITDEIIQGYVDLNKAGYAYSIECLYNDKLVGGLYGVYIGGMVAGESMFYKMPNASKYCLYHLIKFLQLNNIPWLDCQVITPFLSQFGAREISRIEFSPLLDKQLSKKQLELSF